MSILESVTEKLPAWFVATPVGRSLVEQHEKEQRAARQQLVDQLNVKRRDLHATCEKHDRALVPLAAAALAARAKFEAAEALLVAGQRARVAALHALEGRIRDLERDLTRAADPRIDGAKWSMYSRWEAGRNSIARSGEVPTGRFNSYSNAPEIRMTSNAGAITRLSEAMAEARNAFDDLKLKNPDDLDAAIAAISAPVTAAWSRISELDEADGPQAA